MRLGDERPMQRLSVAIDQVLEVAVMILLTVLCLVTLLGVVDRYLFQSGIGWTEELGRFLLIWVSLLSATIVVHRSAHFCITFLVDMLPTRTRRGIALLLHVVAIGVLVIVFVQGVRVTAIMRIQTSPAMDLPMNWIYLSLPVATAIMILSFIVQAVDMARLLTATQNRS